MVSQERAGAGDRSVQFGNEYRLRGRTSGGSVAHDYLRMAMGVHRNWRAGIYLDHHLVGDVFEPAGSPTHFQGRTRLHPERSSREPVANCMAEAFSASANVGFCRGQVSDGSDLVGLSVLGSGLSAQKSWAFVDGDWPAR